MKNVTQRYQFKAFVSSEIKLKPEDHLSMELHILIGYIKLSTKPFISS